MSISSVSSTSSSAYSTVNNNSEITQLEKQKANLEKELKEVNQSKEDAKTKQEKVKQLQLQIQQIEARIQQIKADKAGQSGNAGQQAIRGDGESKPNDKKAAGGMTDSGQEDGLGGRIDVQA